MQDSVEEQNSQNDHHEPSQFANRECFMSNTGMNQEEHPNNDYSCLVHDDPVSGGGELGDIDCEAIEDCRCKKEAEAVCKYYGARPGLFGG